MAIYQLNTTRRLDCVTPQYLVTYECWLHYLESKVRSTVVGNFSENAGL